MGSYARKAKRNKEKLTAEKPPRHCGVHAKMSKIGLWYCPKCGRYVFTGKEQVLDSSANVVNSDTPDIETVEI